MKQLPNNLIPLAAGAASVLLTVSVIAYFYWKKTSNKRDDSKRTQIAGMPKTFLNNKDTHLLPLIEKKILSHDTRLFRFGLPSKNHILGLPIGNHVQISTTINNEVVIRSYTPVSSDDDQGYFDLVIKVYFKDVHPKFLDGGKMTQYLENLKIGDAIAIRGPYGRLQYFENGKFLMKKSIEPEQIVIAKKINMIAGGTGITPMLQLIRHVLKSRGDKTELALLFANQTPADILLKNELDDLSETFKNQFKVWYTVDGAADRWNYSQGFISTEMIKEYLYPPQNDTLVLMCGPQAMIKNACEPALQKLSFHSDMTFAF